MKVRFKIVDGITTIMFSADGSVERVLDNDNLSVKYVFGRNVGITDISVNILDKYIEINEFGNINDAIINNKDKWREQEVERS